MAWFELNRVPDGSGGEAPQYLVAGSHGGEGGPCDFTMLRVYTWGKARKRYETAYVESDLCGRLPIRISSGAKGPEFQFPDVDEGGADRKYVMYQTVGPPSEGCRRPPSAHSQMIAGFSRTGFSLSGFDQVPDLSEHLPTEQTRRCSKRVVISYSKSSRDL